MTLIIEICPREPRASFCDVPEDLAADILDCTRSGEYENRHGSARVYQDGQNPALVAFVERGNYTGGPIRVPVPAFGVLMPLRDLEGVKPPFTALSILKRP